jgi:hypothetical protein
MKQITHQLIHFLDENFKDKVNNREHTTLSSASIDFIHQILKDIKRAESKLMISSDSIQYQPIDFNKEPMPTGYDYDYFPLPIRNEIENMNKIGGIFSFKIKLRKFQIAIVCPKNKPDAIAFIKQSARQIFVWLHIVDNYAPSKCSQKLNIYLYLTSLTKTLPSDSASYIEQIHANTAFTTSCKKVTELNIFREEEWFKVFIHETFHCMGLDFSEFDAEPINKKILAIFPVNADVRLFETYCEMWAEIINVCFIAYYTNRYVENTNQLIIRIQEMIQKESVFSLFQCAKVLNYYGIEYKNLHERTTQSHHVRHHKYKEKTNILSYYILKSIFMFYADEFLQWCATHNNFSIEFNKSTPSIAETNMNEYSEFIKTHYLKKEYTKSLSALLTWFNHPRNTRNGRQNTFELQTLRMSLYEM